MGLIGEELEPEDIKDDALKEFLSYLYDSEKDLELKTHIYNPKGITALYILAEACGESQFSKTEDTLNKWYKWYLKHMISLDRLGRIEGKDMVKAIMTRETIRMTLSDKLTKNLKD